MSTDERGNIYISNGLGVTAFDPKGNRIFNVPTGGGATNNVFAGKNNKLLFITGAIDRISSLKMNVKGVGKFWRKMKINAILLRRTEINCQFN